MNSSTSTRDAAVSSLDSSSNSSTSVTGGSSTTEENAQSTSDGGGADVISSASSEPTYSSSDEITIKLKYLNDDLKIVKARTNEPIGDFKKYGIFCFLIIKSLFLMITCFFLLSLILL